MLLKFYLANPAGMPIYLRPEDIRTVEKDSRDKITTILTMNILTPQGPIMYAIQEPLDDAAWRINKALNVKEGDIPAAPELVERPLLGARKS